VTERSDADLVKSVVEADDRAAFAELIARHQRAVFALAYRVLGRQEEVEDVAQNVFLAVYRGLASFKGGSKFSTWLYRVTYNHACSALRRRQTHRESPMPVSRDDEEMALDIADTASPDPGQQVLHSQVWDAVKRLPPQARAVIELYHGQGINYPEIADILGVPLGTVKTHLHRARQKLREMLTGAGDTKEVEYA
jgi:RNA polymerase sigma-70 factor (ECF subfamily)